MTLTLDFQGQILKMLYLRNGRADWHGTKETWVDRMLDTHCDFELWPHPWPWPLNFKVKFWKSRNSAMGCQIDMERKGCESVDRMLDSPCDFELWPHPWPWPLIFKVKFWKSHNSGTGCPIDMERNGMWVDWMLDPCYDFQLWPHPWPVPWIFNVKFWNCCIPGMAGSIDMEQKGYESIGCYTYFVTLSYDLDLRFSRSNFKNAVSREWEGQLTWNQRDVSR